MSGTDWLLISGGGEPSHVIPNDDLREHECSEGCWCHPTPCEDEPSVIVHHSMDRREEYEEGRALQ